MAYNNLEEIAKDIDDIIQNAINSNEYKNLNKNVKETINNASKEIKDSVKFYKAPQAKKLYAPMTNKRMLSILMMCLGYYLGISTLFLFFPLSIPFFLLGRKGRLMFKKISLFQKYVRLLDRTGYAYISTMAREVDRSKTNVKHDLREMINDGWFIEGSIDYNRNIMFSCNEAYNKFEYDMNVKSAKTKETKKDYMAELQEVCNAYLTRIHELNEIIPDEDISADITGIEISLKRIFERVKKHPEDARKIKKLMKYYLPSTVKLLTAYSEMDDEGVSGENIENSKKEIENTIKSLNYSCAKLLSQMFEDTTWDVASEASVLENLLAQDGLTEDNFK